MTVPIYIAESAPRDLRGRLVTFNSIFITGGQFLAGIVDGAFSYDKTNGWRYSSLFGLTRSEKTSLVTKPKRPGVQIWQMNLRLPMDPPDQKFGR